MWLGYALDKERRHEARNVAYAEYDSEYHSVPYFGQQIDAFIDGVQWADNHPSDETINKILWIWTHTNISENQEINTNDYIREHWLDNFD